MSENNKEDLIVERNRLKKALNHYEDYSDKYGLINKQIKELDKKIKKFEMNKAFNKLYM